MKHLILSLRSYMVVLILAACFGMTGCSLFGEGCDRPYECEEVTTHNDAEERGEAEGEGE